MVNGQSGGAQRYFDSVPSQWDALYAHEDRRRYLVNKFLRKGLYLRYRFTFDQCGDLTGKRVLDIGCGTGRYSIECAKRGAARVVGIDFAPAMVEFSRRMAQEQGVADRCEFIQGDAETYPFAEPFEVVLALGLFDYVARPERLFGVIGALRPAVFVASFPKWTLIWGTQRYVRYYWIRKCPVYNYSAGQIERLCTQAGLRAARLWELPRGILLGAAAGE